MAPDFTAMALTSKQTKTMMEAELLEQEHARFGRNVLLLIESPRFTKAIQTALIDCTGTSPAPEIAHRLKAFLITGTISR